MTQLLFLRLFDARGDVQEATAHRYDEGRELPEGQWSVKHADGRHEVTDECLMPEHWRDQLDSARRFGETI